MDIDGMAAELEDVVRTRGMIDSTGQVISSIHRTFPWTASFEAATIDTAVDVPERRTWSTEQRAFFGIDNPYQMADDADHFTWSNISTIIADPYLTSGEMIAGIIHGAREQCYLTCPCHRPSVVYTTRHRLVCMSCGATHVVLRRPVLTKFRQTIVADEWDDLFGATGTRHHEALDLIIVDVQDIENATPFIWSTNQWDEAIRDLVFMARSTPEEREAYRNEWIDPSILVEAGWIQVQEPPAPASQLMSGSFQVDMIDSAGLALASGARAYLESYLHPESLLDAVKDLFQSIELLLKVRLETSNPMGLRDQPNNPTVLDRLADIGVTLSDEEVETVTRIRRLRNKFQHSSANFNQRSVLNLCRHALILIDRFAFDELFAWVGDVIEPAEWHKVLDIEEIHDRAVAVAETRLAEYRRDPKATITACPRCAHDTTLRPSESAGASCVLCGHVPLKRQD